MKRASLPVDGISLDVWVLPGTAFRLRYVRKSVAGPRKIFDACYLSPTPIMDIPRAPYSGPSRKLVVALDIGTTFSGAAYILLDPGEIPQIQSVTRQVSSLYSNLVTNDDEREVGIQTLRTLGPEKFPPYCITIVMAVSVALKMG